MNKTGYKTVNLLFVLILLFGTCDIIQFVEIKNGGTDMPLDTAVKFWEYIGEAQFDELYNIMCEDAVVWSPNTREVYKSAKDYIEFNKEYPGRWYAEVEKMALAGEEAVTVTRVYDEKDTSFYCVSFFSFEGECIKKIVQYWGENGKPPQWREDKKFVQRY